jgi:hypothetical protein
MRPLAVAILFVQGNAIEPARYCLRVYDDEDNEIFFATFDSGTAFPDACACLEKAKYHAEATRIHFTKEYCGEVTFAQRPLRRDESGSWTEI